MNTLISILISTPTRKNIIKSYEVEGKIQSSTLVIRAHLIKLRKLDKGIVIAILSSKEFISAMEMCNWLEKIGSVWKFR